MKSFSCILIFLSCGSAVRAILVLKLINSDNDLSFSEIFLLLKFRKKNKSRDIIFSLFFLAAAMSQPKAEVASTIITKQCRKLPRAQAALKNGQDAISRKK
jgi:predicted acetyltransferase